MKATEQLITTYPQKVIQPAFETQTIILQLLPGVINIPDEKTSTIE